MEYSPGKRAAVEHPLGMAGCDALHAKRPCSGDVPTHVPMHVPPDNLSVAERHMPDDEFRQCNYMGVRWSKKKGKWRVRIKANGKVSCISHLAAR